MIRTRCVALSLVVVLLGVTADALAQTNTEVFQELQWNFSTPGARANGMGRAFIGIANDASAAVTNPAGLASLTRPQVYLEFKQTQLAIKRLAGQNSIFDLETTTFGESTSGLSFFSIAFPMGQKFVVSFARHQFLDHRETFEFDPRPGNSGSTFFPVEATSDFRGASYAGSIAGSIGANLKVGVTVSADTLKADSRLTRFDFINSGGVLTPTANIVNEARIDDGSATSVSAILGAVFRLNDTVSMGVVHALGSSFTMTEDFVGSTGQQLFGTAPDGTPVQFPRDLAINVPSRTGFGAALRLSERLLVTVDAVRVRYSDLMKDFIVTTSFSSLNVANFTMNDVTEVHAGGEYQLMGGANRVFLRGGVFTNPDHHLTFVPTDDLTEFRRLSTHDQFNLLTPGTQIFGTVGAGIAIGRRAQIDLTYITSKELVVSIAGRF